MDVDDNLLDHVNPSSGGLVGNPDRPVSARLPFSGVIFPPPVSRHPGNDGPGVEQKTR